MKVSCSRGISPETRELDIVQCKWLDWDCWTTTSLQFYKGSLGISRNGLRAHEQ